MTNTRSGARIRTRFALSRDAPCCLQGRREATVRSDWRSSQVDAFVEVPGICSRRKVAEACVGGLGACKFVQQEALSRRILMIRPARVKCVAARTQEFRCSGEPRQVILGVPTAERWLSAWSQFHSDQQQ